MSRTPFSEALQRLLRDNLTSFEQLEIVLLLRRDPAIEWTPTMLCEQLSIPQELIEGALVGLEAGGLVCRTASGTSFRYSPSSSTMAAAIDELEQAHLHHRAALLSTMSVNAIARIRSGPMRAFADAFIMNKKKEDG